MVNAAPTPPRRDPRRWLRSASGLLLLPAALLMPGLTVAQSPTTTGSQPPQTTTTSPPTDTSQNPTDPSAMTPGNTAPGNTGNAPWTGPGTSNSTGNAPGTGGTGTFAPDATGAPGTVLDRPAEDDEDTALPGTGGSGSDPERQLGQPAGQPIPGMEKTVPPQVEVPRPPTPQSGSPGPAQ